MASRKRAEQRNPYKGWPWRPFIRLQFLKEDGTFQELELLADTGNPCAVVVGVEDMATFQRAYAPSVQSNFGILEGAWIRVLVPELELEERVVAYSSDAVLAAAKNSHASFAGLVGLPLLRRMEYGGNVDAFWVRQPGRKAR